MDLCGAAAMFSAVLLAALLGLADCAKARQGILLASVPSGEQNYCLKYYPKMYNLTKELEKAQKFRFSLLLDVSSTGDDVDSCMDGPALDVLAGRVGVESDKRPNCTIPERTALAQSHGATALLFAPSASAKLGNASEASPSSIPVASLLFPNTLDKLMALAKEHPEATFSMYAPEEPERDLDASIFVIFLMAVFTVGLGSLWSGYTKHYLRLQRAGRRLHSEEDEDCAGGSGDSSGRRRGGGIPRSHAEGSGGAAAEDGRGNKAAEEDLSVKVTPILVVFFVMCMCGMLVMLYLFFDKLVYVIIGMFVLASIIATYSCFEPFIMWTYRVFPSCPTFQLPRCNLYLFSLHMELRQFALFVCSVALSIVWVVFRKEDWAWILQDLLGILFSINMLKVLRLPSFKICTILLSILFFYDIFFVFITPALTSDGKSVMVEVATGGGTGEQLPMVLKVPHMGKNPYNACWIPYSMLGFGDILVPGLLLSYCHSFDLLRETPVKAYWTLSYICYWLSLLVCFAGLFLMDNAQPALLYIVPGTLVPVAALALARGEFRDFWEGDSGEEDEDEEDGTDDVAAGEQEGNRPGAEDGAEEEAAGGGAERTQEEGGDAVGFRGRSAAAAPEEGLSKGAAAATTKDDKKNLLE